MIQSKTQPLHLSSKQTSFLEFMRQVPAGSGNLGLGVDRYHPLAGFSLGCLNTGKTVVHCCIFSGRQGKHLC
jgi:hypothetical protein